MKPATKAIAAEAVFRARGLTKIYRMGIARAVAKRPDVLLCDEPTGALDFETGKLVLEVLEGVNQELGTTTAVILHPSNQIEDGATVEAS